MDEALKHQAISTSLCFLEPIPINLSLAYNYSVIVGYA